MSQSRIRIELRNMNFSGHHGLFPEEQKSGNLFTVDVSIQFMADGLIQNLEETINYADVYALLTRHMNVPTPLLETLAQRMVQALERMDPRIRYVGLKITKQNAPIPSFQGEVSVTAESGIAI